MKKNRTPDRPKTLKTLAQKLAAASLVLCAGSAMAGTINTFNGLDDGAPVTGPFPNSAAAQLSLLTAATAFGPTNTITFEGLPLGFTTSPVTVASGVTMTQAGFNIGSGILNTTFGNLNGFNTSPGGSYYVGVAENTTTFNFAAPTNSFGFYGTGLQTDASSAIILTFNDGTSQTVDFSTLTVNGGAEYFGITDTASFSSITITAFTSTPPPDLPPDTVGTTDSWGIDDVSYNSASTAPTPEPSSLLLLGTGALATIGTMRRKVRL
jgi:PEP-CTERM motif